MTNAERATVPDAPGPTWAAANRHDTHRYATPQAMRRALEDRLKAISKRSDIDLQGLRRRVAFDHLLARLTLSARGRWVLKGGYAMEVRFERARPTRDLDLAFQTNHLEQADSMLRAAAALRHGDCFEYCVGEATMKLLYGGARFPVEAKMAGRTFISFHIDAAATDLLTCGPETRMLPGWLAFAGIDAGPVDLMSSAQQFAEKAHAYSLPGSTPTAVSVIDLYLLARSPLLEPQCARDSVTRVFASRATHEVPDLLLLPPDDCHDVFWRLSRRIGIDLGPNQAFQVVRDFWANLMK